MGLLWFGGNIAYGVGGSLIPGTSGAVIGWPIFMVGMVLCANVTGVLYGEWSGTSTKTTYYLVFGLATLLVATVVIAFGKAGSGNSTIPNHTADNYQFVDQFGPAEGVDGQPHQSEWAPFAAWYASPF
jgi:hypothetical protein